LLLQNLQGITAYMSTIFKLTL